MNRSFVEGYEKAIQDVIDILNARLAEEECYENEGVYIVDQEVNSILNEVIKLQAN